MNQRIQELMQEADRRCSETRGVYDLILANLIVAECARVARATPCPYTSDAMRQQLGHTWDMASSAAGREIEEYFGVR
jgi:hypothetical protein